MSFFPAVTTQYSRKPPYQPEIYPNLLMMVLGIITPLPLVHAHEWPNPLRAKVAPQIVEEPNLLLGVLSASPMPFNAQFDWPNPLRAKLAPQIVEEPNLVLNILNVAQPWQRRPSVDLPIRPKLAPQNDVPVNLFLTATSVSAAPLPFAPIEWSNPVGPKDRLEPMRWQTLSYYDAVPFQVPEWANPLRAKSAPQIFEYPNLLLSGNLSSIPALFNAQYDWPNPLLRTRAPQIEPSPNVLLNGLTVYPAYLIAEWPNPLLRTRAPQVEPFPNLLISGLLSPTAALPKFPTEWLNPPRSRLTVTIEQSPNLLLFALAGAAPTPPTPPPIGGIQIRPGGRVVINPKKQGETVPIPFDFISSLGAGEVVLSATTTASVWSGIDSNPTAIIVGGSTIRGTVVSQEVTGGIVGVIYGLLCRGVTNLGDVVELAAYLAVETDLP